MTDIQAHANWSPEAGSFVSSKLQRLAEILKDYDQYLELRWIPYNMRTGEDVRPYCIVHSPPGRPSYVVTYFNDLTDPEDILALIFAGDDANGNVQRKIEAREAAQLAFKLQKEAEDLEEAADKVHFLMTNRSKFWVKWRDEVTGEMVKLDSDRRRV